VAGLGRYTRVAGRLIAAGRAIVQGEVGMVETPAAVRFTMSDLDAFPEDGQRYEVIDGELFVSRAAHLEHQWAADGVLIALGLWSRESALGRARSAAGVIFSESDAVIPDVIWISRERWALIAGDDGHFHGAPDLAVEVLSPGPVNERRDREAKLKLYSVWGVREYWIVDWRGQTVSVYRREGAQLRLTGTLRREDILTSPLLSGFALPVTRIFERV
jgi:Uma2 family endonuclease